MAKTLAWAVIPVAALVLFDWLSVGLAGRQSEVLYPDMVPSTALLFLFSVSALLLKRNVSARARLFWLSAHGGLIAMIAIVNQLLFALRGLRGLDELFVPYFDLYEAVRMSTMTSFCFLLLALALFLKRLPGRWLRIAVASLSTFGLTVALISIVGHIFDVDALYSVSIFSAMSFFTSVNFTLLFLAVLFFNPEESWAGLFLGSGPGNRIARQMIFPAFAAPLLFCYAGLKLSDAGLINVDFRLSLVAIFMILSLVAGLLILARSENEHADNQAALVGELRRTISDRDLLLKEVYHRVKNNLQQINAILFIQTRGIENEDAKNALRAMSGRIESLGVVQRLLLASPTRTELNVREFLTELCGHLEQGFGGVARNIRVVCEAEDRPIGLDQAISMGLLVNELISNAFKYAFDESALSACDPGVITVDFKAVAGKAALTVSDNGRGLPEEKTQPSSKGSGTVIVSSLTEQLGGELDITSRDGLTAKLVLPLDNLIGS